MKAVEDIQGLRAILLISCKYGFHISEQTNSILLASCAPIMVKNSPKVSMVRSLPTQSSRVHALDLVDQGQVLVAFAVLDLIHADGADRRELAVLKSPLTTYSTA